jgi:hypothetical protein
MAALESRRLELSGRVSGIKAQNPINPAAATPARNRNAALYPAPTTMKPAAAASQVRVSNACLPQPCWPMGWVDPGLCAVQFPAQFWGE